MENHSCLNCDFSVDNNFCPRCGQKTDTHRIVLKHFILHDLLHGVWHLEKGILFTLKESLLRPGQAALDYIRGKRVKYYNVFYLSLLVLAVNILLLHFSKETTAEITKVKTLKEMNINDFYSEYAKFVLFSIVPLLALNAKLLFKKLKLNLAEHLIMGGITLLGILILSTLYILFDTIEDSIFTLYVGAIFRAIAFFSIPIYPIWAYQNFTKGYYKFWGFSWRMVAFYLLTLLQLVAITLLISAVFLNKTGAFKVNF